ncbi:MAG: dienelactone hydrolase family protein [Myxococcales bacterium]|nr:dienelactone hydrolase family protein [Myxococcales bacterium]
MSTIVLFHSALGLRPAVHRFADALRADGHVVHTPDLFDGEVFDRLEDGVAKRDALGIPALMGRAAQAVAELPADVVYAGFSMGAASAEWLAATRPGARGAILMHAALPLAAMGVASWPEGVPVQVHATEGDPWVDAGVLAELEAGGFEVHRYPGEGHLFADEDAPEHDPQSAVRLLAEVRRFLSAS